MGTTARRDLLLAMGADKLVLNTQTSGRKRNSSATDGLVYSAPLKYKFLELGRSLLKLRTGAHASMFGCVPKQFASLLRLSSLSEPPSNQLCLCWTPLRRFNTEATRASRVSGNCRTCIGATKHHRPEDIQIGLQTLVLSRHACRVS
jgi:hypothetical protein